MVVMMPLLHYEGIATTEVLFIQNQTILPKHALLAVTAFHLAQWANAFHLAFFGEVLAMSSDLDLLLVIWFYKLLNQEF